MRLVSLFLLFLAASVTAAAAQQQAPNRDGESLYTERCAKCHESGVPRAVNREALSRLSPDAIRAALTTGSMRSQGAELTAMQIEALARMLGNTVATAAPRSTDNACTGDTAASFVTPLERPNWNGWGGNLAQHRFQPAAMAQLPANQVPRLKLKWSFGFPGANRAFAQPTVIGGRVFVGSASSTVYSLNANSGCQYWAFKPDAPVRTAITIGRGSAQGKWIAYFGDQRATTYAVDALTGALLWKRLVDNFPGATMTGAPTLADDTLYVVTSSAEEVIGANPKYECCKFRGSVSALNAATGEVRWKSFTIPEEPRPVRKSKQGVQLWGPSGAGIWSSPAVDLKRGVVYVTTGDSYSDPAANTSDAFVAFDIKTGKLLWSRQTTAGDAFTVDCGSPEPARTNCPEANGPDFDFGSSPILAELPNGRRALIAGQKSGVVHAVDPDRGGEILWQTRVGKGTALGGVQWGSAFDGRRVYVALSDVQPEPAPPGTPGAQPSFFGPALRLNARAGGGLFALDPGTGNILWNKPHPGCGDRPNCSPAQSAAVTAIPGVVFSGGLDGHLRAYASDDGKIIWDVDTAQAYKTVNGVPANGGSLDGPGPVVVGGMVFVNSGYAFVGGMPGNVLLVFSVDGR
jgi:polyvinyl alcohol dehydrogenase (cytochrome)